MSLYSFALGPGGARAESAAPSFGECERIVNEDELRNQVASSARGAMRTAVTDVDFPAIVSESWRAVRFDQKFERIVDAEIAVLRQDRAYLERLLDGNIPSRAEEMAQKTADAVFSSPEFEALQKELQDDIGKRMEPLVAGADLSAQSRAAECIKVFLGERYAQTISTAFSAEARATRFDPEFKVEGAGTAAAFSLAGIVAGMLTIVFRRLVQRIVAASVRRLAGAIAARLIAWASVVLGAAILIYELVAGADGVFPIIKDELTSVQTKQTIQRSLVEELTSVAPEQLDTRADDIASSMIVQWRRFKDSHRAVLELAAENERFRKFVEEQPPKNFERLSVVVAAIKEAPPGGDQAVLDALDRGLLARALQLPKVLKLAETWTPLGVSIIDLVAWRDRTGDRFDAALAARLPLHVKPDALSDGALGTLLQLGDARAAGRIASMSEPARSEALELDRDQLLKLTTRFEGKQMAGLLDAIRPAGSAEARARLLKTVVDKPGLVSRLDQAGDGIAASRKPDKALEILLSDASLWDPNAFMGHLTAVYEGQVVPMIMVYRYGWGLVFVAAIPFFLAAWVLRQVAGIFRFFFGSRRRH